MTVRDQLLLLNSSLSVVIADIEQQPLEEGPAGGLLDESMYLDHPCIYSENDIPFLIVAGITV